MSRQKRVDANQADIVKALRGIGATILHLHTLGEGAPDIVAGYRGNNFLLEIKDGSKPPSKRKLTKDEQKFHQEWNGQVSVVKNEDEAIMLVSGYDNPADIPPF